MLSRGNPDKLDLRIVNDNSIIHPSNTLFYSNNSRKQKTKKAVKMKAIQLKKLVTGPDGLTISNLPDLKPSPDKYLIKIHAAATNFFDVLQIQGKHQQKPDFPWIAGNEMAGEVLAQPTALKTTPKFKVGDRVFGATLGTFATQVHVEEEGLRPMPKDWSFAQASGLFYTAPTAYAALILRARAKKGMEG